jgi:hypothetical protein
MMFIQLVQQWKNAQKFYAKLEQSKSGVLQSQGKNKKLLSVKRKAVRQTYFIEIPIL